jgi:hypothetical protein
VRFVDLLGRGCEVDNELFDLVVCSHAKSQQDADKKSK